MELKDVLINVRDSVFNDRDLDFQTFEETGLTQERLAQYYSDIIAWKIDEDRNRMSPTKKKLWSKAEDRIIIRYMEDKGKDGCSNSVMIRELEEVLVDRTSTGISYQYYNNLKGVEIEDNKPEPKPPIQLIDDEKKEELDAAEINNDNDNDNEDLIDIVSDFVENVEKANVDVTELFSNLRQLSVKAVENNSDQIRIDELEGHLEFYKNELENEKERNNKLQNEVYGVIDEFSKIKKEVEYFDSLNGKQKLTNLSNFSSKLKVIVDKFGGVVAVKESEKVS